MDISCEQGMAFVLCNPQNSSQGSSLQSEIAKDLLKLGSLPKPPKK